eukprot:TRINITY_DN34934_c0_g1_i1.p1 TRINITY_DN34934_c0_g1~~TRINITY_DN34934_c0_g1_i1.p1  ORF type:complete len:106 (-),score=31.77 TRINITY_DN34934_c0_g1_i1:93-410(-)
METQEHLTMENKKEEESKSTSDRRVVSQDQLMKNAEEGKMTKAELIKQLVLHIEDSSCHPLPPPVSSSENDCPPTPPSTPFGTLHPGRGLCGDREDIKHGTKEQK